jgi:thiosulfate/3-mercaptopyruvate sulfurtransferase
MGKWLLHFLISPFPHFLVRHHGFEEKSMSCPLRDVVERRRATHLVETDWLEERLGDPSVRIVDVRGLVRTQTDETGFQTAEYLGAREAYAAGHIPGAVYLDWTRDLIDEDDPVPAQVAPPEKLARVLGERGIGEDTLVVAYDDHAASQFATRLWWVLRYYGHENCRVLDGGWSKWKVEGRPVSIEIPRFPPATFAPRLQPQWRKTAEEVLAAIGKPDVLLVDARDEGQYTGRIRRGVRGGHIPGAVSFPRERLVREDHTFESMDCLLETIREAGVQPDQEVIAYCNGGVAATSVLFALSMLGYPRLSNYDGSWNEWNRREELPVESQ